MELKLRKMHKEVSRLDCCNLSKKEEEVLEGNGSGHQGETVFLSRATSWGKMKKNFGDNAYKQLTWRDLAIII